MLKFFKNSIQIIFIFIIILMIIVNLFSFGDNLGLVILFLLLILGFSIIVIFLYKKEKLQFRNIKYVLIAFLALGILIRIYLIFNINIILNSDFAFFYEHALGIINGNLPDPYYLSYNGYAYNFAYVLSIIIKVFGKSVTNILLFNLFLQIVTIFIINKISKLIINNETVSLFISVLWFLLPTVIFANLLVSTETLFILLFMISIYFIIKFIENKSLKLNLVNIIFLGICLSITNSIRPLMLVFIIAVIIMVGLNFKNKVQIFSLIIMVGSYFILGQVINRVDELKIGESLKSGAIGWSVYYGSSVDHCGAWNLEDNAYISERIIGNDKTGDKLLVSDAIKRYHDAGIIKTGKLMSCKFKSLWSDNNSTYVFAKTNMASEDSSFNFDKYEIPLKVISDTLVMVILIVVLMTSFLNFSAQNNTSLLIELSIIGYVLSNLIVCLNGRYNFPIYPLLLMLFVNVFKNIKIKDRMLEPVLVKMKKPKVLLIVPAYNEAESITKTCDKILKNKRRYDFVVINDGSTDDTEKIIRKNNYNYINLVNNLGIGGAVQTGYKYALENDYDIAIQFDGDGQHDINYIEKIIKPIQNGEAEFVIGSRFIGEQEGFKSTKFRRLGITILSSLITLLTDETFTDPTSGFRAANRNVINLFAKNYPAEYPEPESINYLIKNKIKIKEVPVKMQERTAGLSSITALKSGYYMINVCLSMIIATMRKEND